MFTVLKILPKYNFQIPCEPCVFSFSKKMNPPKNIHTPPLNKQSCIFGWNILGPFLHFVEEN